MVLPIIIGIAVIALLFTFRDQIKAFADNINKESTPEEVEQEKIVTERGAIKNTQAFILGEKGLADLDKQSEANRILIDKFLTDSQMNIDQAVSGVNETLVQAQQNLERFATESQATITKNVNQFQKDVDTNISGIGSNVTKFFSEASLNLSNFFGGQATPKAVATSISPKPALTTKQGSPIPDLSFLTPNTSFDTEIPEEVMEAKSISSRRTTVSGRFG